MQILTADSPYSLENFSWLMEHSAARNYLSDESLAKIDDALKARKEPVLQQLYPVILEQYVREREITIDFALQQEGLMNDFVVKVEKIGYNVTTGLKKRNRELEERERQEADEILKKLT